MDNKKIIEAFNKGTLKINGSVEEREVREYEVCTVKIDKAHAVEAGDKNCNHPLVQNSKEGVLFVLELTVKFPNGEKVEHIEAAGLTNRKGRLSIYPTFQGKDGEKVPGTLLYDIIHRAKLYNKKQANTLEDLEELGVPVLEGVIFEMEAKKITTKAGEQSIILKTSKQEVKDEEYAKQKSDDLAGTFDDDEESLPF